jgi:hypothetical protein
MRRISAAFLMMTAMALGVGCESDDNNRDWDNDDYRGDRVSRNLQWDSDRDRDWERTRDGNWDRHYKDGDWDRARERDADHWRNDRDLDDRKGEGLMDRDQNRNTWDRR